MTMTIMYLTVAFLLAALAVSGLARVRGLEFAHGGSPVDSAAILLVIGLVIDLVAQLTLGTQGWLNSEAQWNQTEAQWTQAKTPYFLPDMYLWKVGLVAQLCVVLAEGECLLVDLDAGVTGDLDVGGAAGGEEVEDGDVVVEDHVDAALGDDGQLL